jgi:hemerythrin
MAVGIPEIDRQHQELIALINSLFRAVLDGKGKKAAGAALRFLKDYIVIHFATEERFMAETGYPLREQHHEQHQIFIGDFNKLITDFEDQGSSSELVVLVNEKVVHWLIEHIMKMDRQLARHSLPQSSPADQG